jgi:hypothetical protein
VLFPFEKARDFSNSAMVVSHKVDTITIEIVYQEKTANGYELTPGDRRPWCHSCTSEPSAPLPAIMTRPAGSRVVPGPNASDPRPAYEWIRRHSGEYRGKWVALYKGELAAASESFNEVLEATRDLDPRDTIFHFID